MQQEDNLIERLGYDIKDPGVKILKDIIMDAKDYYKSHGEEECIKVLNKKDSPIYVEVGYFYYEIGLKYMWKELERVHQNRDIEKVDIELYTDIFNDNNDVSIEETIVETSKYLINQEKSRQIQNDIPKQLVMM